MHLRLPELVPMFVHDGAVFESIRFDPICLMSWGANGTQQTKFSSVKSENAEFEWCGVVCMYSGMWVCQLWCDCDFECGYDCDCEFTYMIIIINVNTVIS